MGLSVYTATGSPYAGRIAGSPIRLPCSIPPATAGHKRHLVSLRATRTAPFIPARQISRLRLRHGFLPCALAVAKFDCDVLPFNVNQIWRSANRSIFISRILPYARHLTTMLDLHSPLQWQVRASQAEHRSGP